jgi:hypothetical protein
MKLKLWKERYPAKESLFVVVPAQNSGNNQSRENGACFETITAVRAGWLWGNHYYDCPILKPPPFRFGITTT